MQSKHVESPARPQVPAETARNALPAEALPEELLIDRSPAGPDESVESPFNGRLTDRQKQQAIDRVFDRRIGGKEYTTPQWRIV